MPIKSSFVMAVRCCSKIEVSRISSFSKFSPQAVLREADDSREETTGVFAKAPGPSETIKIVQLLKEMFIYMFIEVSSI